MSPRGHIVVDVSGHGFGHAAQAAPVVAELRSRLPEVRLTLRTRLTPSARESLFGTGFDLAPPPADVGLHMVGPMDVDREGSARAYAELHFDWPAAVDREARALEALAPDLLLADVPYSSLAAAARIGLPALALSSLNWADIYHAYCHHRPEARRIASEAAQAYASARLFLQATPHMPMEDLPNRRPISPLARSGADRREELRDRLGAKDGERLVLVSLGGIPGFRPVDRLPSLQGVRWIFGDLDPVVRDDVASLSRLGLSFVDALASCDAIVAKTGYGMFAEAAGNGTRVLFARRPDWPESPWLEPWIEEVGCASGITREDLESGRIAKPLEALLERPSPPRLATSGAGQVVDLLVGEIFS